MEFTGHYDGKNNPIFEGDLIQFTPETPKKNKTYPLMMVFWNNEKARWSTKIATEGTPEQGFSSITESPERHLVVGNIYENRDLLNG